MINWLSSLLSRWMRTDRIATQNRDDVAIFEDWSNVLMGCCDCGLMHRYDFSADDEGRLCIRGRRDFSASLAIRRDRDFPFKDRSVGDSQQQRDVMIALLMHHYDTLEELAKEFEQRESDAMNRSARARMRMKFNVFGDESKHTSLMDTEADRNGRRAAALRALLAQPRQHPQLETFWNDIGLPEDPIFPSNVEKQA